ncbi:hypothetical protein HK101_003399 [Irineochytrium annulatum]|nr:hypothetical protein HK101_003399 [Irineochytrium annulatum]
MRWKGAVTAATIRRVGTAPAFNAARITTTRLIFTSPTSRVPFSVALNHTGLRHTPIPASTHIPCRSLSAKSSTGNSGTPPSKPIVDDNDNEIYSPEKDPMAHMTEAEKEEIRQDIRKQSQRIYSVGSGVLGIGVLAVIIAVIANR